MKSNASSFLSLMFVLCFVSVCNDEVQAGTCARHDIYTHTCIGKGVDPSDRARDFFHILFPNPRILLTAPGVDRENGNSGVSLARLRNGAVEVFFNFVQSGTSLEQCVSSFLTVGSEQRGGHFELAAEVPDKALARQNCELIVMARVQLPPERLDESQLRAEDYQAYTDEQCLEFFGPEIVTGQVRGAVVALRFQMTNIQESSTTLGQVTAQLSTSLGRLLPMTTFQGSVAASGLTRIINSYRTVIVHFKASGYENLNLLEQIQADPSQALSYLTQFCQTVQRDSSSCDPVSFTTIPTLTILRRASTSIRKFESGGLEKVRALMSRLVSDRRNFQAKVSAWQEEYKGYEARKDYKKVLADIKPYTDNLALLERDLSRQEKALQAAYWTHNPAWNEEEFLNIKVQLEQLSVPTLPPLPWLQECTIS